MADRFSHRLTWDAWLAHLDALSRACAGAGNAEEIEMLRELNLLLERAPSAACHEGVAPIDRGRLEQLLDLGMSDGVLIAMLTRESGFVASRGRGDCYFVTVMLPGALREEAAFGASLALAGARAVICALAEPLDLQGFGYVRMNVNAAAVH